MFGFVSAGRQATSGCRVKVIAWQQIIRARFCLDGNLIYEQHKDGMLSDDLMTLLWSEIGRIPEWLCSVEVGARG